MLSSRNLSALLAQALTPEQDEEKISIVSSILITPAGETIASQHLKQRIPPRPTNSSLFNSQGIDSSNSSTHNAINDSSTSRDSHSFVSNSDAPESSASNGFHKTLHHNNDVSSPFNVSRSGKTKVYTLFASSLWKEYLNAGLGTQIKSPYLSKSAPESPNNKAYSNHHWISVITDDNSGPGTIIFIMQIKLPYSSEGLLLVLIADANYPQGLILKKAEETVVLLEEGLQNYKINGNT